MMHQKNQPWHKYIVSQRSCLFSDSGKLGICRDHPHRQIEMKFCVVGALQVIVLSFKFHQN